MEEGFKTIQEILKEVAEDEGMTKRQIKDLWSHHKSYIINQMKSPEVYAIHIPVSYTHLTLPTTPYV